MIFIYSSDFQDFEENMIYVHVPLAWFTIFLYFYIIYIHLIYYTYSSILFYFSSFWIFLVIISGYFWSYLTLGFIWYFDLKIFSYLMLFISLLLCHLFEDRHPRTFFLIFGLINYFQLKFAAEWFNTAHQSIFEVYEIVIVEESNLSWICLHFPELGLIFLFLSLILIFFGCGIQKL